MRSYGMLSSVGNERVDTIVQFAMKNDLEWPVVLTMLRNLASEDYKLYGEAMDTAVRENVYEALLLTTDFYA